MLTSIKSIDFFDSKKSIDLIMSIKSIDLIEPTLRTALIVKVIKEHFI